MANSEVSPWTFVSKTDIHDGPFVGHTLHELLNIAGNPVSYSVIHFKNRAVGVVAYEDGCVHLVGQFRYAVNHYSWELPEGGCPADREPIDAAKWELAEETGLRAERILPLLTMHPSNSNTDEVAYVFLATGLTQGEAAPEENEVLQNRKVPLDDILKEIEDGKITDAMTVAAIYKLAWMRATGQV